MRMKGKGSESKARSGKKIRMGMLLGFVDISEMQGEAGELNEV